MTYVDSLREGKPLSLIHIHELVLFLLTGRKRNSTGCGVEKDRNLDLTGGQILACADLGPDWSMGTVGPDGHPVLSRVDFDSLVAYKVRLGCARCGVHGYCGGRCPVEAVSSNPRRLLQYCQLMRLHVGCVQRVLGPIGEQMQKHRIDLQRVYDESAYYVQFTDVTP